MNNDMFINYLAYVTGSSRNDILKALKQMSAMPEVQKKLKNQRHGNK